MREEDVPKGPALAVLSYGLWSRAFGGDPRVLGRRIDLKGEDHVVIGVMAGNFHAGADVDVWTPLARRARARQRRQLRRHRAAAPGRRLAGGDAQLKALSAALREDRSSNGRAGTSRKA